MFLSDLRAIAACSGLRESSCRACPAEDWAPTCAVCGGSMRVWIGEQGTLSDEDLAGLRGDRAAALGA